MAFQVNIRTDNAAFADDPGPEVARILRKIADGLDSGWDGYSKFQTVHDVNGNDVGRWKLEAEEAAEEDLDVEVDEVTDTEPCEECGNDIPVSASDEGNRYHRESCSLHPDNVVDARTYPEDDDAETLREASTRNPDQGFTSDGSDAPERPQS